MEEKDIEKNQTQLQSQVHVTTDDVNDINEYRDGEIPTLNAVKVPFFRSTLFQMLIISLLAFSGPAQSDAISGLGGGGMASADLWNLAEALFYAIMVILCFFGGPIVSKLGVKKTLIIGSLAFPVEGVALYVSSRFEKAAPFLVVGEAIAGIGSGLWYVGEAASVLSIPESGKRGKYLGIWITFRNLGQLVGGSINLGMNSSSNSSGSVNINVYFIFIALECIGFPASFLLSHPEQVQRKDGTLIRTSESLPLKYELKKLKDTLFSKVILLLSIVSFYSFFYISPYSTYLTDLFTVRARSLSSLISPTLCIFACFGLGVILDYEKLNQRTRAYIGFSVVVILNLAVYIWTVVVLNEYNHTGGTIDWTSSRYAKSFLPYFFVQSTGPMSQSYIYWLISSFSTDVQSNARMGGIFRSIEAAGQAISYGIMSVDGMPLWAGFGANFGLLIVSIIPTFIVISGVNKQPNTLAVPNQQINQNNNQLDNEDNVNNVGIKIEKK